MNKVCPICEKTFYPANGNQVYCDLDCKEEFSRRRKREARKLVPKICNVCKNEFLPTGHNGTRRMTCSDKCSLQNRREASKAWKLAHKGEIMPSNEKQLDKSGKVSKPDKRNCKYCGGEFTPRHNGVKYCDDICKTKQNKEDKAEREKLGIKPATRKTREQEYVPDKDAIFNNQFILGFMSIAKREFNHSSDRYRL